MRGLFASKATHSAMHTPAALAGNRPCFGFDTSHCLHSEPTQCHAPEANVFQIDQMPLSMPRVGSSSWQAMTTRLSFGSLSSTSLNSQALRQSSTGCSSVLACHSSRTSSHTSSPHFSMCPTPQSSPKQIKLSPSPNPRPRAWSPL